jgi:DNA-binding winged helix-turn-helix (wHTH) protein/Tol biopolymer transport system component
MMASKSFVFSFDCVEVREREFSIIKCGEVLAVEPKAFRVLLFLLRNPGKLIAKEELLNAVWGDAAVTDSSLVRSVALLRRLLGDETRSPRYIETVATVGYRFVCKVEAVEDESGNLEGSDEVPAARTAAGAVEAASGQNGDAGDEEAKGHSQAYSGGRGLRRWLAPTGAIVAVGLVATALILHRPLLEWVASVAGPPPRVLRLAVSLPPSQGFVDACCNAVLFTPDGSAIVYSGRGPHGNQLYYRRLDQLEGTALPGTEASCCATISPSGDWVAFESGYSSGAGAIVSKVSLRGGAPIKLAEAAYAGGLSWGPDDSIYSAEGAPGLFRIPANGGPKQRIAVPDAAKHESEWFLPLALPDGKTVLVWSKKTPQGSILAKVRIADGAVTELDGAGKHPIGVAGGYLFFGRVDGALGAAPFDPDRTRSVEAVIPVLDAPLFASNGIRASISQAGDLVYVKGSWTSYISYLDAQGHVTGGIPEGRNFVVTGPRVSPDGRKIVVEEYDPNAGRGDLWVYDIASGTRLRLTTGVNVMDPEWTPDGKRILYRVRPGDGLNFEPWWAPADGSGSAERFIATPLSVTRVTLSLDSRYAVLTTPYEKGQRGFYVVDLKGDRVPKPLETSPSFQLMLPDISPDGHWMVYESDESGRFEVYLRPFPVGGAHLQVSVDGGRDARWEKDSHGIIYHNANQFMRARLAIGSSVTVTQRDLLFTGPYTGYDLMPNGGFIALRPESADAEIIVVTNFISELKAKQAK